MIKILDITYANTYLKHIVNNSNQLNAEERTLLLRFVKDFEDLFDGTLGNRATDPINLDLKTDSRPCNSRYYMVPRINKETFRKELKGLV